MLGVMAMFVPFRTGGLQAALKTNSQQRTLPLLQTLWNLPNKRKK